MPAYERLLQVTNAESAQSATWVLLDALGHNHSGMVRGGELLVDLMPFLSGWALAAALEVLTDCYLFVDGVSDYGTADGVVHDLTVLQPTIASLDSYLRKVILAAQEPEVGPANELLATLAELPPSNGEQT